MKKLYRKGTVHPSPPIISDQLSFLPAAILTLTAALSPEDREVLAYLISCSASNTTTTATTPSASFSRFSSGTPRRSPSAAAGTGGGDHAPVFNCSCFGCYMSYWGRWDSSPNRQLIDEIIDEFEEWLDQKGGNKKSNNGGGGRKEKRNKRSSNNKKQQQPGELTRNELVVSQESNESTESESVGESSSSDGGASNKSGGEGGDSVEEEEKGSVRRFVSFIGERIWGAWGQ